MGYLSLKNRGLAWSDPAFEHIHSKSKELRFGKHIAQFVKGHIDSKKLIGMEHHIKNFKRTNKRIGDWLIEKGYINNLERDGALERQLIDYSKLAESNKIGKPLLVPIFNRKLEKWKDNGGKVTKKSN